MTPERRAVLLKRRHMLLTKGGELTPGEVLWLESIEAELATK
jgi:hypothetical protein